MIPSEQQAIAAVQDNFENSSFFKMLFMLILVEEKKSIKTARLLF